MMHLSKVLWSWLISNSMPLPNAPRAGLLDYPRSNV